jgi:hypothetical protein
MKEMLIDLEQQIHRLQVSTKEERDKFIFQICRELVFIKIEQLKNADQES